jgi:ComEC/Rec2-related protein
MIRRHLTPALLAFSALLVCCAAVPLPVYARWLAVLLATGAAGSSVVLLKSGSPTPFRRRAAILLMGTAAGLSLGAVSMMRMWNASSRSFLPVAEMEVSDVEGVVTQDSVLTQQGDTAFRIELVSARSAARGLTARARGGMLLLVPGDLRFSIGERLHARVTPSVLATFGPERWIARARPADVSSSGFSSPLWSARAEARDWLHRSISEVGYPASSLLEALLVGVRQDVPDDLYQGFARTGSLHILALSGLHVTVIYGVAAGLLWFLRRRWLRFLAATVILLFYQVLAGFMPSLLRATVMIVIGGIAVLLDRDREPINILALSGIALLLVDPFQAFTVSFQLSFLALAGILVIGALAQRPLTARLPKFILLAFAMSAGAQAATLPLVIGRFGAWYPSGLLANLVLVPLTTGYLWAGLAWLPLSTLPWPALHQGCAAVFDVFYRVIHSSADLFARFPGLVFPPASLPWLAAGTGLAAALASTLLPWKRPRAPALR